MRLASTLAFQYVFATLVAAAGGVLALAAFDWPLVKGLLWGGVAAAVLLGTALGFTRPASTAAPTPARRVGGAVLGLFVFGNLAAALVIGWAYIAHFGGATVASFETALAAACVGGSLLGLVFGFTRPR